MYHLGLRQRDMIKLAEAREQLFYTSLPTLRTKITFLQDTVCFAAPGSAVSGGVLCTCNTGLWTASCPAVWCDGVGKGCLC